MNAKTYALALWQVLHEAPEGEHERLIARFVTLLKSRRHERLIPAIVKAFEQHAQKQTEHTHIVVAKESDAQTLNELINKDVHALSAQQLATQTRVDENLIGGYVVTAKGQRIDHSHRRTLIDMYTALTGQV